MVDGFRPALLQEALKIRSEYDCTPIAGGTDLMVQKARGFALKPDFEKPLLFIGHLPELHKIIIENNQIHIGAGALLTDLLNSKKIPAIFKEAIGLMASPPSRNLASIGGNICNASPAGDTLPYLYAVNATLVVMSAKGERTNPINEFITGPKQTALRRDELLTKIIIPNKIFDVNFYRKVGQRNGMSLTKAAFLGMADIENGKLTDIRITFGSVAPVIVRSWEIEKYIIGTPLGEIKAAITEIQNQFEPLLRPINDARSTAVYRKKVSLRLLEDFLKNISKEK